MFNVADPIRDPRVLRRGGSRQPGLVEPQRFVAIAIETRRQIDRIWRPAHVLVRLPRRVNDLLLRGYYSPDKVGPTGCIHHTSECDGCRLGVVNRYE